jgi:hypothetical protein
MPETEQSSLTVTVTIDPSPRADELAAQLRKVRDVLARAYRNALIGHDLPVYHPAMQGLAAASINIEGVIQQLDPPRVVGAAPGSDQAIRGLGRA